jgi:hypothetical protein
MCFSAGMYFFNNSMVVEAFTNLGYPTYIIYPLATAKILGLIAIWTRKSSFLIEFAYSGFFFNLTLAFFAHIMVGDGEFPGALLGMVLLVCSYFTQKKYFNKI